MYLYHNNEPRPGSMSFRVIFNLSICGFWSYDGVVILLAS